MLCARVVTNASNALTVTPLANRQRLQTQVRRGSLGWVQAGTTATYTASDSFSLGWARTPLFLLGWEVQGVVENAAAFTGGLDWDRSLVATVDRYGVQAAIVYDAREVQGDTPSYRGLFIA